MLEELGPTFIKFGQVLSTRPDLVSRPYVEELRTLQDRCEALAFDSIRTAIEAGLGKTPEALFASIDPIPVATASMAQVHRGVTKDGETVAIKVQRPAIGDEIRRDIDLLYRAARFFDAVIEESAMAEPVGVVQELDKALTAELNFLNEAANCRLFGRLHESRPDIVVPTVFDRLSSTTVLTLSFIEGVPFSRLPDDIDRPAIARRIIREAFDEVFIGRRLPRRSASRKSPLLGRRSIRHPRLRAHRNADPSDAGNLGFTRARGFCPRRGYRGADALSTGSRRRAGQPFGRS